MQFHDLAHGPLQAAFVAALVVHGLLHGGSMRSLRRFTSEAGRLAAYRADPLPIWAFAAAAVALAWPSGLLRLPFGSADAAWLLGDPWMRAAASALVAVGLGASILQGLRCVGRPEARRRFARAASRLRFFMPVSPRERRWWVALSVTAGVCEELIFRGFLLQLLSGHLAGGVHLPLTAAWVAGAALFGLGHVYQGVAGVVSTTVGGLLFGLLAILAGNLVLPIVVHVLVDLQILWMYRPAQDDPDEARRLIEGREMA